MEAKLFDGDVPHVSTFAFHEHRERAPHLEQDVHRGRLEKAFEFVTAAVADWFLHNGYDSLPPRIVDLGCGDGGLLSLVRNIPDTVSNGYDFQPSNVIGWMDRHVQAEQLDFVAEWVTRVRLANVYVITECLEHLADPHETVRRIRNRDAHIVASSPHTEHAGSHDECHAWAWDLEGYENMLLDAGFTIRRHETVGMFQVIWGSP